jgi:hypothetical protein
VSGLLNHNLTPMSVLIGTVTGAVGGGISNAIVGGMVSGGTNDALNQLWSDRKNPGQFNPVEVVGETLLGGAVSSPRRSSTPPAWARPARRSTAAGLASSPPSLTRLSYSLEQSGNLAIHPAGLRPPLSEARGQPLVLRPKPWRQVGVWLLGLLMAGLWIPEILSPSPGHLVAGIAAVVVIGGLPAFVYGQVRLVVTPDAVIMRDVPRRRGGSASRADVRSVHIYSARVCLQAHGETLLKVAPYWSAEQLTRLAAELRVPLVTHKKMLGLTDERHGTVLYQSPQDPNPAAAESP